MYPKITHSAIICGATGCGKTAFVLDLLETEYLKFFENIIIICPTWFHNKAYIDRPWFKKDSCVIPIDPSWCSNSKDWLNEALEFAYKTYGIQESHTLFIIDDCS